MSKNTNRFSVKSFNKNKIVVEEERKSRSALALFFIKNGRLIFTISLLFSLTIFIIALVFTIFNIKESTIVEYESNGVIVTFDSNDSTIINGVPITDDYAEKVFDNYINVNSNVGVVIKVDEIKLDDRVIIYYSDNTALIKYNNGEYAKVYSVNNNYGINKNGIIDSNASIEYVSGRIESNYKLNISLLYLSDGTIEITRDDNVIFIRNNDITINDDMFYANLSMVSLPVNKDGDKIYFSDGTVKEGNTIIVDNKKFSVIEEKNNVYKNVKIIYYENGYAEIDNNEHIILVRNGNHIVYNDNYLEIIDNSDNVIEIKDVMDIKEIILNNTNEVDSHYIIVLEETDDYKAHNVDKILDNKFIRYNIDVNSNKVYNNVLDNNLKDSSLYDGIYQGKDTYLLYEGTLEKLSSTTVRLGLWVNYEEITSEYMNSAFIGTVKVYVESLG